ncbi:thioredoxin [Enterococcus plantarum]|uniref:Thioredoxin n=1 Tax=Enterococcus plantarum TaxID=1077675 RepID=A0A2W4B3J2_9ENTE|nr:DsbA family protein [Enterococcus plantarum]MBO0422492.1 DsbA family protein [Enterococcus plantarum]OEG08873.1 thioredoxin [Enterococcus plantarum]PZL70425.1 thioredoxin [Enterococcus plantarum]
MDISIIDATKVTTKNGLAVGKDSAPVKMVEFMNVRCPYCKKWFEESFDLLNEYVKEGKVQRIIKLLDKEKESLQRGNVMHHHINYDLPEKALTDLKQMYDTQDTWGNLSLEDVAIFAEDNLQLPKKEETSIVQAVIEEAAAATIKFVPTIVIGEHIFDESITKEELIRYIEGK